MHRGRGSLFQVRCRRKFSARTIWPSAPRRAGGGTRSSPAPHSSRPHTDAPVSSRQPRRRCPPRGCHGRSRNDPVGRRPVTARHLHRSNPYRQNPSHRPCRWGTFPPRFLWRRWIDTPPSCQHRRTWRAYSPARSRLQQCACPHRRSRWLLFPTPFLRQWRAHFSRSVARTPEVARLFSRWPAWPKWPSTLGESEPVGH